jgi:phosphoribosyl-ATP pyrophosphohydrolase/phosphoribosyl-AMP cyclohydrolase
MQTVTAGELDSLAWEKGGGLLPAVVQDAATREVLMVAYVSRASLERTFEQGLACFFSRTRQALWTKGETSGHTLAVRSVATDCDRDSLLVLAEPRGPVCHRDTQSCFDADFGAWGALWRTIEARAAGGEGASSYTRRLLDAGVHKVAQKVGEEAVETALAAKDEDRAAFLGEAADLVYHLLVLLKAKGVGPGEVGGVLEERAKRGLSAVSRSLS